MADQPLAITDRRRAGAGDNSTFKIVDTNGAGPNIGDLFRDKRISEASKASGNGKGKNTSMGKGRKIS